MLKNKLPYTINCVTFHINLSWPHLHLWWPLLCCIHQTSKLCEISFLRSRSCRELTFLTVLSLIYGFISFFMPWLSIREDNGHWSQQYLSHSMRWTTSQGSPNNMSSWGRRDGFYSLDIIVSLQPKKDCLRSPDNRKEPSNNTLQVKCVLF